MTLGLLSLAPIYGSASARRVAPPPQPGFTTFRPTVIMVLEEQAKDLRAELSSLKREIEMLKNERDVARLLNEYIYVHDAAFSPVSRQSDELDAKFEDLFTDDGICDA